MEIKRTQRTTINCSLHAVCESRSNMREGLCHLKYFNCIRRKLGEMDVLQALHRVPAEKYPACLVSSNSILHVRKVLGGCQTHNTKSWLMLGIEKVVLRLMLKVCRSGILGEQARVFPGARIWKWLPSPAPLQHVVGTNAVSHVQMPDFSWNSTFNGSHHLLKLQLYDQQNPHLVLWPWICVYFYQVLS